jgi:uncharacterized membrane protein SpoIIM required for sporulation
MVIEKIVSLKTAIRNPLWVFVIGGIISAVCLIVSYFVSPTSSGMFFTFLITIAMTPFMINLARYEEAKQEEVSKTGKQFGLLYRYSDMLRVYTAFFCGMIFFLSITYLALPHDVVSKMFQDQIQEISLIRGSAVISDTFTKIVVNNVSVLMLTFLFSFLFGAGAIFILAWNASVLSTAIGLAAQSIGGVKALPLAVLVFFPHGSLEILAYFIGGISGGLVSAAITRRKSLGFGFIMKDSLELIAVSVLLLVLAGLLESIQIAI